MFILETWVYRDRLNLWQNVNNKWSMRVQGVFAALQIGDVTIIWVAQIDSSILTGIGS